MKKIASHGDIEIFAPSYSRFSFLKSPYAAHQTFSAVDIYYGSFGSEAFSPVDGEIIGTQSFKTPTPYKDKDFTEYVIAVQQGEKVIKILHIKPEVSAGETVSIGDRIGRFVHNGYFIFWNDPVMHVEVRKKDDYLRARNDLCLAPNIEWTGLPSSSALELECSVEKINERYALLSAPYMTCGEVKGFAAGGGFIDGYVSCREEGFFGIIRPGGFSRPHASLEVKKEGREAECAGVAFSLFFNEPRIKVIPVRYGDRPLSRGDRVTINLEIF